MPNTHVSIERYLERLETLVKPERAAANEQLQEATWAYQPVARLPRIVNYRDKVSKERRGFPDWPRFTYAEVFQRPECMLLDELEDVYVGAMLGDDKVYTIRANYGVGILPSVFGCEVHLGGENDLPWVEHLEDVDAVRRIVEQGVPLLDSGLLARATETQEFFREALAPYPQLRQSVHISQPDLQGPMNVAAEIMGTTMYTAIYDHPDLLHDLINLVTETYIKAAKYQKALLGEPMDRAYHWHLYARGGIRISEDFGLSLSPGHYRKFVAPYNARVYAMFGGGYLLHADEGLPQFDEILNTPGITGIYRWTNKAEEFSTVWEKARERRICLIWSGPLPQDWREQADTGLVIDQVVADSREARKWLGT